MCDLFIPNFIQKYINQMGPPESILGGLFNRLKLNLLITNLDKKFMPHVTSMLQFIKKKIVSFVYSYNYVAWRWGLGSGGYYNLRTGGNDNDPLYYTLRQVLFRQFSKNYILIKYPGLQFLLPS